MCYQQQLQQEMRVSHICLGIFGLQCESKKKLPLKLFAIFSLIMNMCN